MQINSMRSIKEAYEIVKDRKEEYTFWGAEEELLNLVCLISEYILNNLSVLTANITPMPDITGYISLEEYSQKHSPFTKNSLYKFIKTRDKNKTIEGSIKVKGKWFVEPLLFTNSLKTNPYFNRTLEKIQNIQIPTQTK